MTDDMTCQEVVELVTAYLEGALSPEQAAQFEQHVDSCDGCERYVDQMRTTIATVGRIEDTDVPPELRDRLLVAFRSRSRT
jgi:anti-sigma factor (TIGR02949 family)